MPGFTARRVTMLGLVDPEQLIPGRPPIRDAKPIVDAPLEELEPVFAGTYSEVQQKNVVASVEVIETTTSTTPLVRAARQHG